MNKLILGWIKRKLGIERLESEVSRLQELECFSLADVADRLSECYVILAGDEQILDSTVITVPANKKGILILKNRCLVRGCVVRPQKTRTIIETLEEDDQKK